MHEKSQQRVILTENITDNRDNLIFFLASFNNSANNDFLLDETKHADVNSIYKKESGNVKENYRTASILPNLSELFEVVRVINLIFTLVR